MPTIRTWLASLGTDQYADAFEANHIDFALLAGLSEQDLKDLGVGSLGHRRKLLAAIEALRDGEVPVPVEHPAVHPTQAFEPPSAERRQLTILFCDLVGSTALSACLDPEQLREVVRDYQARASAVVARFEGCVAQHLGDGLLVYFGYPAAHEDDAQRAVRAALGIVSVLREAPLIAGERLSVRIGIHTGLVVIGTIGGSGKQEQLALGEAPNVAARLQGLAQPGTVLTSNATARLLHNRFVMREMGPQSFKGVHEPLTVFEVLREADAAAALAAGERIGVTPLVGRDLEVGLLVDRWEKVCDGKGQMVLLQGEPGIGKSRLVRVLREEVRRGPHHRLEHRCSTYAVNAPLFPLIDALPAGLGFVAQDSDEIKLDKIAAALSPYGLADAESAGLIAGLLSVTAAARFPLPLMSPERQKRRTLETLVSWALRMAEEAPLLYVLEDLHWVDPTTMEYLSLLQEQIATARVLLLLTARPSFHLPWAARTHLTSVPLDRFSKRQTEQMVARVSANKPLPNEVVEQIIQKTDGVPLFVEELTKMVLESDLIKETPTHYELTGPLPPLAIPSTLQDSLMARLDRLGTAKEVAQLGAALGRSFSLSLLKAVAPVDEAALAGDLAKLADVEILYRRGMGADTSYVFKHALIQDAAYQSLLKSTRQIYHQRIATAMVARFSAQAEEIPEFVAHHFTEAGTIPRAVEYWSKSGRRAMKHSAYREAIAYYQRGLNVLTQSPASTEPDRLELELQLSLGLAIIPLRGYAAPEAVQAFSRASELAEGFRDTPRLFDADFGLALGHWIGTSIDRGRSLGERCLTIARDSGDDKLMSAALYVMGGTAFALGRFADARHRFEHALAAYDHADLPDLTLRFGIDIKVAALHFLAPTLWFLGYPEQALARVQELIELLRDTPYLYNRIWRSVSLVQLLAWLGESHPLERQIDLDIALCDEQHFYFMGIVLRAVRGARLAQQGRIAEGMRDIKEGIAVHRASGAGFSVPMFLAFLAQAHLMADNAEEGLAAVAEGLQVSEQFGELRSNAELHRLRGELLLRQAPSDHAQAEAAFHRALEIAREQEAKSLELRAATSLARLWQSRGKGREARDLLAPAYNWFTEGFDTKDLKDAKALLSGLG